MTSLLAPTSLLNKATGSPSSNLNFTQRSLNSNPYRFPYRLSFLLLFCLTPPTFSMGTLLSPSQECHPFSPLPLSHDLVVSALIETVKSSLEEGSPWIITPWIDDLYEGIKLVCHEFPDLCANHGLGLTDAFVV